MGLAFLEDSSPHFLPHPRPKINPLVAAVGSGALDGVWASGFLRNTQSCSVF